MSKIKLSKFYIKNIVKLALKEDLYPSGDITSNLIKNNKITKMKLISNQRAVIGGLEFGMSGGWNQIGINTAPPLTRIMMMAAA